MRTEVIHCRHFDPVYGLPKPTCPRVKVIKPWAIEISDQRRCVGCMPNDPCVYYED